MAAKSQLIGKADADELEEETLVMLQAFANYVLKGAMSPCECTVFVANGIQRYIDAGGDLSLDKAFGLHS